MARIGFTSVDEYIAAQPKPVQPILKQVRRAIRKAVPEAAEAISYQIPAYKGSGGPVVFFAGFKKHYSLYPATDPVIAAFRDKLGSGEIKQRTIRFPLSEPVPVRLIERIAKFRAKELTKARR